MTDSMAVNFATAGLGGIGGWWVVHPFNTLAVRMNLAGKGVGFPAFAADQIKRKGFGSLYDGIGAGTVRQIFYATSRFGLFEVFRDQVAKYREVGPLERIGCGLSSGACAAFISCPAEVSLVRMANDSQLPLDQRRNYKGVADAAVRIVKEEGVAAFWRGSAPFVNRAMLVGVTQVGTLDQFKHTYDEKFGIKKGTYANVFAASFSSGLLYSIITMPFESAKNRMAMQKPGPDGVLPYRTIVQTFKSVAAAEGVLGLWSGFIPYYGRCGGHTVTMFIFVELLRDAYKARQPAKESPI
eukprot:m.124442 g.124442  ORF g.124442 m.124442 type:complete len:297 (-) comp29061_c0_seq1:596-1486(-)